LCAAVERVEKLFEPGQQGLTVTLDGRFGEVAEVFGSSGKCVPGFMESKQL
jgi:hypothetical protein